MSNFGARLRSFAPPGAMGYMERAQYRSRATSVRSFKDSGYEGWCSLQSDVCVAHL